MDYTLTVVAIVLIVVALAAGLGYRETTRRRKFDEKIAPRTEQRPQEFADECQASVDTDTAERVRRIVAKVSEGAYAPPQRPVNPTRLRADDELSADLGYDLDSLSYVELMEAVEKEFGVSLPLEVLAKTPSRPLKVGDVVRAIDERLKKHPEAARFAPEFRPGVRLSISDLLVVGHGIFASILAAIFLRELGLAIVFVVGHFFLFCNVFRVSRLLELIWSGLFLALAYSTVRFEVPSWPATIGLAAPSSLVIVGVEMRKPSYHGIFWQRINPRLPEWWAERSQRR